jgi:dihydroflavonol-4-reductase
VPLEKALEGCDRVYHLAGFVSRDAADSQRMMRVHIDGTRRVLDAAKGRRVVVASTSGTIAVSKEPEPIPNETWPYATELVSNWPYYLSKIYQEKLALGYKDVIVVNPSLLLGPGDERQSSTGDVKKFLRREIPIVPPGGINFVDARDAASASIAAMERGRPGERYLLGGPNWTMAEFFGRLERTSKVRGPRLKLPDKLALGATSLLEHAYKALHKQAPVERSSVEMSQVFWYCDSSKAERELGFSARDPGETLDDTVRDLRSRMI